jgi:hypothetical protein
MRENRRSSLAGGFTGEGDEMTKHKKMLVVGAGALLLIALIVYGVSSLSSKMDEAQRLKEQIADASGEDGKEAEAGDGGQTEETGQPGNTSGESGGEVNGAEGSEADGSIDPDNPNGAANGESSTEVKNGQGPAATPGQGHSASNGTATDGGAVSPGATAATPSGSDSGSGTSPAIKPSKEPGTPASGGSSSQSPAATTPPDEKDEIKQGIDAAITKEMEKLRTSCSATSSSLVNKIAAELKADPEGGLDKIQGSFMDDVVAAEAKCDSDFSALIAKAKQQYKKEGIPEDSLPDWSSEYASSKEKARANALSAIANAM